MRYINAERSRGNPQYLVDFNITHIQNISSHITYNGIKRNFVLDRVYGNSSNNDYIFVGVIHSRDLVVNPVEISNSTSNF